jgi:hypothetical protein
MADPHFEPTFGQRRARVDALLQPQDPRVPERRSLPGASRRRAGVSWRCTSSVKCPAISIGSSHSAKDRGRPADPRGEAGRSGHSAVRACRPSAARAPSGSARRARAQIAASSETGVLLRSVRIHLERGRGLAGAEMGDRLRDGGFERRRVVGVHRGKAGSFAADCRSAFGYQGSSLKKRRARSRSRGGRSDRRRARTQPGRWVRRARERRDPPRPGASSEAAHPRTQRGHRRHRRLRPASAASPQDRPRRRRVSPSWGTCLRNVALNALPRNDLPVLAHVVEQDLRVRECRLGSGLRQMRGRQMRSSPRVVTLSSPRPNCALSGSWLTRCSNSLP